MPTIAGHAGHDLFESVRWNACVQRLDLGLYSHRKELGEGGGGDGVRTHVNSKGKIPSTEQFSPEEDRTHHAASNRTASSTHYQLSCFGPRWWYNPTER